MNAPQLNAQSRELTKDELVRLEECRQDIVDRILEVSDILEIAHAPHIPNLHTSFQQFIMAPIFKALVGAQKLGEKPIPNLKMLISKLRNDIAEHAPAANDDVLSCPSSN